MTYTEDVATTALAQRYHHLLDRISHACEKAGRKADSITLVAVTKTMPAGVIQSILDFGIANIGENRVQEIIAKRPLLTGSFLLHLIGHLQSNKVAKVLPLVDWIHSLDSISIIDKVNNSAQSTGRRPQVLVQVNTSGEKTKSGCMPEECPALCDRAAEASFLDFRGLMTIGPFDADEYETRKSFSLLRRLGEQCTDRVVSKPLELSMGMSNDFEWAIQEGATMIRIGSLLVGPRGKSSHT